MSDFHLIYKNHGFNHLTLEDFVKQHQVAIDHSNKLNPITNVTTIEVAEKLFAAQYITGNIKKTDRILNSDTHEDIKGEYQNLLHEMIHQYHTLSAHDFLANCNFYVINID